MLICRCWFVRRSPARLSIYIYLSLYLLSINLHGTKKAATAHSSSIARKMRGAYVLLIYGGRGDHITRGSNNCSIERRVQGTVQYVYRAYSMVSRYSKVKPYRTAYARRTRAPFTVYSIQNPRTTVRTCICVYNYKKYTICVVR